MIEILVNLPTVPKAKELTLENVWFRKEEGGMVVAGSKEKCPIWKDTLPYKSVTVVCEADQESDVSYWLEYVHGGGCISKVKSLKDGKIAIRSNYMCW